MNYGQQSIPLRVKESPCNTFTSFDRRRRIRTFLSKHAEATRNNITVYKQYPYGILIYEGWNFNSGNYLFTTDTK